MRPTNSFQLIGRLVNDPEFKQTSVEPMVTFRLAEKNHGAGRPQFHECAAFGSSLCKQIMDYLLKGRLVLIQGEIRNRIVQQNRKSTYMKVESWMALDRKPGQERERKPGPGPEQPPEGLGDLEDCPEPQEGMEEAPPWE